MIERWLIDRAASGDPEARAVLRIFAAVDDSRAWDRVDPDGIDFRTILADATWSGGERRMMQVAANLWNPANGLVDLTDCCALDARWFGVVLDAIVLRRAGTGGRRMPLSESDAWRRALDDLEPHAELEVDG